MAEGTGLEPASLFRAAVFKTAALPITLPLQNSLVYCTHDAPFRQETVYSHTANSRRVNR